MLIGWFPLGTFRSVPGCALTRSVFALPDGRPVSINVAACGMDSQYRFLRSLIRKVDTNVLVHLFDADAPEKSGLSHSASV